MAQIKSKDTTPELKVKAILRSLGYRYRRLKTPLPGSPDIIMKKYNSVIFVHGCYWHRHQGCKKAATPKSQTDFWQRKFAGNVERDRRVQKELKKRGWKVMVVWECQLSNGDKLAAMLNKFLSR